MKIVYASSAPSKSAYYAAKAAQCRRLAGDIVNQSDPAAAALRALALEYDTKSNACAALEVRRPEFA